MMEPGNDLAKLDSLLSPAKHPFESSGTLRCDLHARPFIKCEDDFLDVLDAMVQNNIDLVAITTSGKGREDELSYHEIKHAIRYEHAEEAFRYEDRGEYFFVTHRRKRLAITGAYPTMVSLEDVGGLFMLLSVMPEEGFWGLVSDGMPFGKYIEIARLCDAIVIASQPYAITEGNLRKPKFVLAGVEGRDKICKSVFPKVDCLELIDPAYCFSSESDVRASRDFRRKPMQSSGLYAKSKYERVKIGYSGTVFSPDCWFMPREQIRYMLNTGEFTTYMRPGLVERVVGAAEEMADSILSRIRKLAAQ